MPQKQIDRQTAARVPEAEQPYPVPDNWAWVTLDQINQRISKTIDPTKTPDASFELYSVPSFDEQRPECLTGSDIKSSKQRVNEGDVLLCKINPHLNRVWIVGNFSSHQKIASSEWIVITPLEQVLNQYMRRYLQSNDFRNLLTSQVAGIGGSLVRAQPKNVRQYPVPVPPLAEQRRIVAKLDSLLGKLRAARDLLDAARDSFALRRAAILHKAFSGQLTAAWRKEHPDVENVDNVLFRIIEQQNQQSRRKKALTVENMIIPKNHIQYSIPDSWKWVRFEDVCKAIKDGTHFSPQEQFAESNEARFLYLTSKNIRDHGIVLDDVSYINEDTHRAIYEKCNTELGDVLLVKDGVKTGTVTVNTLKQEFSLLSSVAVLKVFKNSVEPNFLKNFIKSPIGQEIILGKVAGSAITRITLTKINKFPLPLAPFEEQREIVRRLDALLTHEAEAAALLDMDEHLDLLEQSILARAFRGELGTRDPADAPAVIG